MLYAFEDCVLDDERREFWRAASPVSVGPQVFDLLAYLIRNRERVVSQDDLLAAIWEGRTVSDSTLRSHINAARTAIGDDGEAQRLIRTMPRKGFRFVGEVREQPAETSAVAPADVAKPAVADAAAPPPHLRASIAPRRRYMWAAAAVAVLVVVAGIVVLRGRLPAAVDNPVSALSSSEPPASPASPRSAQSERSQLVPELVPFISERDREAIRDVYMSAPDHKAIAIGFLNMSFVSAQPDKDTAETAAVAKCQSFMDQNSRGRVPGCQLFASGNVVTSTRGRPPMPPQPWIIRDPSIETPFAEKDVPLINNRMGDGEFAKGPKLRALAISATGRWYMFGSGTSIDDAVRRALEWCGYVVGAACMIVAVGDTFVVPIPRTMKVVGFARSGPINAVAPELRDDVARRLANATSGWSAVAIGASGRVGVKLGASTEQAAIDGSMEACSRQDRDCRVAVLGPFLVDRGL